MAEYSIQYIRFQNDDCNTYDKSIPILQALTKQGKDLSTKGAPQTFPRIARECFFRFIN